MCESRMRACVKNASTATPHRCKDSRRVTQKCCHAAQAKAISRWRMCMIAVLALSFAACLLACFASRSCMAARFQNLDDERGGFREDRFQEIQEMARSCCQERPSNLTPATQALVAFVGSASHASHLAAALKRASSSASALSLWPQALYRAATTAPSISSGPAWPL